MGLGTRVGVVVLLLAASASGFGRRQRPRHLAHDPAGYVYHEHSLQHPYMANGMEIPYWEFTGNTVVSDDHIRLTPDRQSRQGALWNSVPFTPNNSDKYPSFEMTVQFQVHGQGTKLYGDGLALWYTKDRLRSGPVFGNEAEFVGMGIFFDTYSNVQQGHQQYISVMIGDGKQVYDHEKDGGDAKIAGCSKQFRSTSEDDSPVYARVVYERHLLRLYVDVGDGYEECFVVRRVFLPRGYHFGVTAATGDLADNHDIISIKVSEATPMPLAERIALEKRINEDQEMEKTDPNYLLRKLDPQYTPEEQEARKRQRSGGWVFWGVIIAGIVIATFVVICTVTADNKKKSPRFDF